MKTRILPIAGAVLLLLPLASCTRDARKSRSLRRAEAYFSGGQFDNAKVEYLKALRLDAGTAIAYRRLGQIWFEDGAPIRAVPFLLKSKELVPDDLESRLRLIRVLTQLGRRADAFAEVLNILEHSPNNGEAGRLAAEIAQTEAELNRVDQALARAPNRQDPAVQLASATIALRRGDREAAKRQTRDVTTIDPKSSAAHSAMATIYLSEKNATKAAEELKRAAELSTARSGERIRYAQFQIRTGAVDDAVKNLTSITSSAPDFLPAWLLLAEVSLGKSKYDECLTLIANVLSRDPDNIDATVLQARSWTAKGQTDRAVQALERLDAKYPAFPPLKYELARCYLQKNNAAQATTLLNQAQAVNHDYVDAALLLAQINLRTGKADHVVEAMLPLIAKHPDAAAAKLLLADAYRSLGQFENAANIFREELKVSPDSAEAFLALGIVLQQQNKLGEARSTLEKARQLAPKNPLPLMHLVDIDLAAHQFENAQHRIQEQLRDTPNSALLYLMQGTVGAAQRDWGAAEASLSKALDLNPDLTAAYELLAAIYSASNRLPDAARQLESVIARTPNATRPLMSLAALYDKMHDYQKAQQAYERVLKTAPDFAPALNNLAFIYLEQLHQVDRAFQLAQKAHTLQPGDGSIADTLGWVMFKKRDYAQAITLLSDAAGKSPNDPEIRYHLGMCRYVMGDADAARTAFEQAVKSSVDFSDKADAQRRLTLLLQDRGEAGLQIDQLKSMVTQQPDDVIARVRLAEKYRAAGRPKDAAAELEEVLKINPKYVIAMSELAELYSEALRDDARALEYAKSARQLSPGNPQTLVVLGRVAFKAGNHSWAYSLLKQACDQLPNDPDAAHAFAWAAFSLGKDTEAAEQMRRVAQQSAVSALAEDAADWLALIGIAGQKQPDQRAAEKVSAMLKKNSSYVPALLAEAAIAANKGDSGRAVDLYENVLNRFPDCALAEKHLALLYARHSSELEKADDLAQRARKALPEDTELIRAQAEISYQRKDYARTLELLDEQARKQPLNANDLYYKGMCSLQTKDTSRAREALTQALAIGLKEPLANDARRALQDTRQ